ncbi:hypothetical protein COCOR_03343 [Corallococcus coralloides DSM 2259]|uniref:Uncharacterized protein n=1 Tax=Corallococcus coralloides (strain ATCC 25202 / DSM 2259 / NBRC 100086 / M2) TaxID=1144275 RepID=H8MHX7_CORCM|nr:hypothetical protein [Corallococcus coralloides]AFE05164.1 hypothetical protein COCOR_03343 [Corallococcus coralloides DSM 2259]
MRVGWIILGLGLCAGVARAEWTHIGTLTGIPKDVTVFRPGFFAVATDSQLYVSRDGVVTPLNVGMAGSFLRGANCVVGIRLDGTLQSVGGCSPTDDNKRLFPDDGSDYAVRAARVTADGGVGYAVAAEGPLQTPQFRTSLLPKEGTAEWGTLPPPLPDLSAQPHLAVLAPQADGQPQALFSVSAAKANFLWYRGTSAVSYIAAGIAAPNLAQSVVLLPGSTPEQPLAFFGNDSGLFRGTLGGSAYPFEPIPLAPGSVDALALDVTSGSSAGTGFGLLLLKQKSDGKVVAYSAEPVVPPALPGTLWRQNTDLPASIPHPALRMACADASYCVAILNGPAQNVLVYRNASPPNVSELPPTLSVDEGTTRDVELRLRDPDGDAVRLSATVRAPGSRIAVVQSPLDSREDSGLKLTLTAPSGICASETSSLDVVASDGLRAHDTAKEVKLVLNHSIKPGAPQVAGEGNDFFMGGPSGTFTATRGATGCEPVRYSWTEPPGAPRLAKNAGVATFTPPSSREDRCKPGMAAFDYEVRADDGALTSEPTKVPVRLHPWGPPDAPFTSASRDVFSGAALIPQATHPCGGSPGTPGLPPVSTFWSVLENPSNATVTALQGNDRRPVGQEPIEGNSVLLAGATCVETLKLKLRAFNRITVDGFVLDSPTSDVEVTVKPRWVPLESVQTLVDLEPAEERMLRGRVKTDPPLNCTGMRPLTTVVTLEDPADPTQVFDTWTATGGGGDFVLDLPAMCGSANYTVRARVHEGSVMAPEVTKDFRRQARDVVLGELSGELVATCGEGARGTLRQTIPEEACSAVNLVWGRTAGPEMASLVAQEDSVSLATVDTQLESLVGELVTLNVSATGEGASGASREHAVRIGARPFVTVARRTETGEGINSGQVGVTVTLRNDTACDVSSIHYRETVTGAQVVPQSVTLNGQPVTPVDESAQHFEVASVPLPAGATARLTYVVRTALLAPPKYSGTASLREVVVSHAEPPPASTSGCGCSGGGSGVTAFGLGALAWAARRRRGVRARS